MQTKNIPLAGRTAIVTGASRGIGRAFAHRLAAAGAAVTIAAKSESGTERLPGSIYSVAAEIENAGGRALAVRTDVRSEADVARMVEETVARFGGVDILVNNAGALWWEPLLATPPKRYDLMWEVNVRGSYLCAYYALPHMIRGGWGHVVTCSPPIDEKPSPNHVCYMTTKMGMTRLAIGIAAEQRENNVAANALWPATPIESYATRNWPEEKIGRPDQWRSPDIFAMRCSRSSPASRPRAPVASSSTRRFCGSAVGARSGSRGTGSPARRPTIRSGSTAAPAQDVSRGRIER